MSGLALLDLLVLDLPVVVLVKESEDLPEVLGLLLQELIEDVELCPLDLVVVVQVISFKESLFDFFTIEVLEVVWIGS